MAGMSQDAMASLIIERPSLPEVSPSHAPKRRTPRRTLRQGPRGVL